jgi:hypothetical protein
MITLTAILLGFIRKTWHVALPIDLPVFDYKTSFSVLSLEVTTGPRETLTLAHSVPLPLAVVPNEHLPADPAVIAAAQQADPSFSESDVS